jgi:hypothetical protein
MYSCVLCLLPFSGLPITVALISSQRISAGGVAERGFIVGRGDADLSEKTTLFVQGQQPSKKQQ